MKFCFRRQFKKYKKSSHIVNLFNHYDVQNHFEEQPIEIPINESNNMAFVNDGSAGGGDDRVGVGGRGGGGEIHSKQIPTPVDEQQISIAQDKVDRLMNIITDTYEQTLVRNLRLEELDMRSTDLFRDAEKMKNMAHKMQDKFFWEDKYYLFVAIASVSAIILGGLLAFIYIPKLTGN